MNTMFLVYNIENPEDENEVVAVFNDGQLATAFTERHPLFHGCYRIEKKEVNPFFEVTEKWLYPVIIDTYDNFLQANRINSFDKEQLAYHSPVSKHDDTFYMYLFANDKNDAKSIAKARF